jgi:hypothetical protein
MTKDFDRPLVPAADLMGLTRLKGQPRRPQPFRPSKDRCEFLHFLSWYIDDNVVWMACRTEIGCRPPRLHPPTRRCDLWGLCRNRANDDNRILVLRVPLDEGIGGRAVMPDHLTFRAICKMPKIERWAICRTDREENVIGCTTIPSSYGVDLLWHGIS